MFRRSSPLGQLRPAIALAASAVCIPASGCQGRSPLRVSAPGPFGAEVHPLACARDLPSGSIRLVSAQRARGSAPAPRRANARSAGAESRPVTIFKPPSRANGRRRQGDDDVCMDGFLPLPLLNMEATKAASGSRSPLRLAYAQPEPRTWRRQQEPLPGALFDITVIGLFVVLGIAYFC